MYHGNQSTTDLLQSLFACPNRLISRPFIGLTSVPNVAVVGIEQSLPPDGKPWRKSPV
jgi:hypothetical protein